MAPVKKLKADVTSGEKNNFSHEVNSSPAVGFAGKRTLSLVKHKPVDDLFRYPQLIYGERKIGKTSLVSMYGSEKLECPIYAFMFEENNSYELFMTNLTNWQDFIDTSSEFLQGKHPFVAAWLDNGRNAYDFALEYTCKKFGFEHPGKMNDRGDSWNKVNMEFTRPIRQLLNSKYPLIVTCHEAEKEIETRSGRSFVKMQPDLSGQASRLFTGEFYNIFYYHFVGNERYLQIQGDEYVMAGHRMEGHFLTTTGEKVCKIPMGKSKEEAYKNLIKAYRNEQKETFADAIEPRVGEHLKKEKKKV